jgi:hypothetical protein
MPSLRMSEAVPRSSHVIILWCLIKQTKKLASFNTKFTGDSHLINSSLIPTVQWLTLLTPKNSRVSSLTYPCPPCGSLPFTACFSARNCPHPVTLLPIGSGYFSSQTFSRINTLHFQPLRWSSPPNESCWTQISRVPFG